mmetsp:Transcript_16773/g.19172  ORF Transcript_16773/g.19172 Transcript_16773/m.19172 type:complete len:667 (+) Transcript_16773:45-2045(+)
MSSQVPCGSLPIHAFCALIVFSSFFLISFVDAHGFLKSPRSRNYYAHVEGVTWGSEGGDVPKEYCHHCLNFKEDFQVCATGQTQGYDNWKDVVGNQMPFLSQATYVEGQEIVIESELTANHAGHMDIFLCGGPEYTPECFLSNPATFIEDMLYGGPVDPAYPSRAYYSTNYEHKHKYRLPMGVTGQRVMMQWRYITANSCHPAGYNDIPELVELGWLRTVGGDCDWPPNQTGVRDSANPEQFWNCADISILPGGPTKSPIPTKAPVPSPTAPTPTAPTPTVPSGGCCSWWNDECPLTSDWCDESEDRCESGCSGKWIEGSGPTPTAPTPTPPTGTPGVATTTRYWDCSGGACGCAYLPFGPGSDQFPAHCYSNAMFTAPANNPYGAKFYGTAAVSSALGGGDWMSEACGKCWKVTGSSNLPGSSTVQTTLVLKGANYCPGGVNPLCDEGKAHFDIAAPGFDVAQFSASRSCATREGEEYEGFTSCGGWMIDSQDPNVNCDCSLFDDSVLRAGCENFLSLEWNNPEVEYEEVVCPSELTRLNCWEENGNQYPDGIPDTCASNVVDGGGCTETSLRFQVVKSEEKKITRDCGWAANNPNKRCTFDGVSSTCPNTCGTCDICEDSQLRLKVMKENGKKITRDCIWVSKKPHRCNLEGISEACRSTCGGC